MPKSVRVLVVEDFEPIRDVVCKKLQTDPNLQVVGQVSDGLEAVQKAQELQPQLILLDIGLPTLNGLEAARRIRIVSPSSKIVFLTQANSTEMIEEALRIGAKGYIVKVDIARELLRGVAVVLSGKIFISSLPAHSNASLVRVISQSTRINPHVLAIYRDDASLVNGLSRSINDALYSGSAAIAVVTESHRDGLLRMLRAYSSEVDTDMKQGRLVFLDAAETLAIFSLDDQPDISRFNATARNLIDAAAAQARAESQKVFVCGECPSILLAEGNLEATIQLEQLWADFLKIHGGITLHCAYLSDQFESLDAHIFERVSARASAVLGY